MTVHTCYFATSSSCALMGIMDRLWFHQVILFADHPASNSLHGYNNLNPSEDSLHPVHFTTTCDEDKGEASSCLLMIHHHHLESNIGSLSAKSSSSLEESYKSEEERDPRPTREITVSTRSESMILHKYRRCRSFKDLEMEEVKGFMDLGFIFKKENLNPLMMSVIPGLQRLGLVADGKHEDEGDEKGNPMIDGVRNRPYLSEAWLVWGPDSPFSMRKVYPAADMKMLLKYWAKSVASAIHRQS